MNKRTYFRGALVACVVCVLVTLGMRSSTAHVDEPNGKTVLVEEPCHDPIAGDWVGHLHYSGSWYRLTLEMERPDPSKPELKGRILSRFWTGLPEEGPTPKLCDNTLVDVVVEMPAKGHYKDNALVFIGGEWSVKDEFCGKYKSGYIPDGFLGRLESDTITLKTDWLGVQDRTLLRNKVDWEEDGTNYRVGEVNFRRVRCAEVVAEKRLMPELTETPAPPAYRTGCMGCF